MRASRIKSGWRYDEDEEILALLRSLAAEGFDQLDQGDGIVLDGERRLASFMHQLGRRAAVQKLPQAMRKQKAAAPDRD
ncbi:MAG: hypothetical protein ACT4QC_01280 [Planctomycetaceae bacterium]